MAQYYGIYSRGAVPCSVYAALATQLPGGSRVARKLGGRTQSEVWLADIRYLAEVLVWQGGGSKGRRPKHPLERSDGENIGAAAVTPEEWKARWHAAGV